MSIMDNENDCSMKEKTILINENRNNISVSESSGNVSVSDSDSNLTFDFQIPALQIKPDHWTEAYWETITSHYKWFIHMNGNAGCSICYMNKTFMGKKSFMATFKLRIMNLSYEEFEKKLIEHSTSTQHDKSFKMYKELNGQSNKSNERVLNNDVSIKRSASAGYSKKILSGDVICSLCNKEYRFKKSLAKHIFHCNRERSSKGFISPCECKDYMLYSIVDIDDHNINTHKGKFLFQCKLCEDQYKTATELFGHLLMDHDYQWNPYQDMPLILVNSKQGDNSFRVKRNSLSSNANDSVLYRDSISDDSNDLVPYKRKKMEEHGNIPDKAIEKVINQDRKEASFLKLAFDQIHTCKHCGGRYLSLNILNEHISTRHASLIENMTNEDDMSNIAKKPLTSIDTSKVSLSNDKSEPSQAIDKHNNLKKKSNDDQSGCGLDYQISACLLSCPLCQECFSSLDLRNDHVSKHHPEIQQFICQHCGLIFTNHTNYNRHLENTHNCNSLVKPSKSSLIINFSCISCPLVFTNQADLNHHINLSHSLIAVKTAHLEINKTMKSAHNTTSHGDGDKFLGDLIRADSREKMCKCSQCDTVSHNDYELVVHSLSHSDNDRDDIHLQSCPNCSRLFFGEYSKAYLKDHYNIVHLKKPAPYCSLCKTTFVSSFAFDKHLETGVCETIGLVDPYHALMADDKLAFSCSQCGAVFAGHSSESRLDIHSKTCTLELMDDDEFLD